MAPEWTALPATLDLLGECPLWDRATRTLFWTDIPGDDVSLGLGESHCQCP